MAIYWSDTARHDVARIFDFNATYDPCRAVAVDGRLIAGAEQCMRNPMAGRPTPGTTIQERSLTDIQYVLQYRVDGPGDITMLGIRHTRENKDDG